MGKWRVAQETSPIDDSTNVYLWLQAEEMVRSGYDKAHPKLCIRCKENKTEIYLDWDLYLGNDSTDMLIRFDRERAITETWMISTDNKAVFVNGSHISFVQKMMDHSKLLTQIVPYGESPVMATFDIRGLNKAIKQLRNACNW